MKKRLLAIALVLIMAFTLLPVSAHAADGMRDVEVEIYTADEKNAGTDDNVWIEVEYEDGSSFISDNLDHKGTDFDRAAKDEYTITITDKPVKKYIINKDGNNDWLIDQVKIDGVLYAGPGEKLKGEDSFEIIVGESCGAQDATVTVITGDWDGGGTDGDVYATFFAKDKDGHINKSREYKLDDGKNNFEAGDEDKFNLRGLPEGTIVYCDIRFKPLNLHYWDLESVRVSTYNESVFSAVHRTFPGNIDDDTYRIFFDTKMTTKLLGISAGAEKLKSNVYFKFIFKDGIDTSRMYVGKSFEPNQTTYTSVNIPDKEIDSITVSVKTEDGQNYYKWFNDFLFDGVRYDVVDKSEWKRVEEGLYAFREMTFKYSGYVPSENEVRFRPVPDWLDITDPSFTIKDFCITEGEAFGENIKVGETISGKSLSFLIDQKPSAEVASWFNERFGRDKNTFGKNADMMDFAIQGDLTVKLVTYDDSGEKTVLPVTFEDVCFAYGGKKFSEYWWLAQKTGERIDPYDFDSVHDDIIRLVGTSFDETNNTTTTVEAVFSIDPPTLSLGNVYIEDYKVIDAQPLNAGSVFGNANMVLILGIGIPVIVIAAAAVVLVLRKKKKNAETAE